jgi:hypothetical protein
MNNASKLRLLLQRTMIALEPYRDDVVLIGGFAKTLYRHAPGFRDPGLVPQATLDIDLALPEPLLLRNAESLHERLEAAGLVRYVGLGLGNQPACHRYHLAEDGAARPAAVHLEFVVPLHGADRERPGRPQPDLLAHALRFIALLQADPVTVSDPDLGRIRLPHPLTYAIQKTRIWRERQPEKAQRDQADVFYVVLAFQSEWGAWRSQWQRLEQQRHEWSQWLATTREHWLEHYRTADAPGSRGVAQITGVDARAVQRIMADFQAAVCPVPPAAAAARPKRTP